jgi:4-hydroxybenzoate polyprenyltransferase
MDEQFFLHMVKSSGHIAALLRLIRWPNLLIVAATQILIRYCIIKPLLGQGNMTLQLPENLFFMLVAATVLTTAAGYVINDYFDRKIDRVNKPSAVIVGKLVYPRHAMAYHLFFSIAGTILGIWVSFRAHVLFMGLIFFMVNGLLWFYSTTYKRQFLLGNFIVALLAALVPFLVLLYELPLLAREYGSQVTPMIKYLMIWVLGFALFAFLLNLIREFVKDAEDLEGDKVYGKRTIAVVWGIPSVRWIAAALLLVVVLLLISAWYFYIPDGITLIYFILFLIIPLLVTMGILLLKNSSGSFHQASLLLKFILITGLSYMIIVNIIISRLT